MNRTTGRFLSAVCVRGVAGVAIESPNGYVDGNNSVNPGTPVGGSRARDGVWTPQRHAIVTP